MATADRMGMALHDDAAAVLGSGDGAGYDQADEGCGRVSDCGIPRMDRKGI